MADNKQIALKDIKTIIEDQKLEEKERENLIKMVEEEVYGQKKQ